MRDFLNYIKKMDWLMLGASFLLAGIGLVMIYSISLGKGDSLIFKKQVLFFTAGIFLIFIFYFFNWRIFRDRPYFIIILYSVCILALAGLLFLAPAIRGTRSWYKAGLFSIDPVEFAKIVLIILLAKYFSTRHIEMYNLKNIILSGIYILLPAVLIFLQPNFGSALILVALWCGVLIVSGIKLKHFLILILCGAILFAASWSFFLKDYQKGRIIGFLLPQTDPLGMNWSQNQSEIAIGSGGIFGQGFTKGSQTQHGFLTEPHTDFIFAAFAEEFGLVGVLILFFLYLTLIWRIIKTAIDSKANFPRLFASGFAVVLIAQFFINIGMNLGLLPVIGISLPFVSYGGSGLLADFACLGILQSIKNK